MSSYPQHSNSQNGNGKRPKRTVIEGQPRIILNNQGQTLPPILLNEDQHILGRDPQKADLVLPMDWTTISGFQAILKRKGNNYYIYDGNGRKATKNGLFIRHTRITPSHGYCLKEGDEIQIGQNPQTLITLRYELGNAPEIEKPLIQQTISLKNNSVLLGRDPKADFMLDSPTVSRRHAVIDTNKKGQYVIQDFSTNGVFVNGRRVNGFSILPPGANIHIGPYLLMLQGHDLLLTDTGHSIRLDAYHLVRKVKDKNGKTKRLLNNISLPFEPGQLVALVGGSGAGKSTLMRTLLGVEPTTEGSVFLNGENLRTNFNIYRTQIGYVPQDDIIHQDLKVEEVLRYAAKLRLPPDIDIEATITKTLEEIEMTQRRDVLVKNLSGGQRKRVSIAVELLADPKLFFLDEPTSGLDPGLDKKMMELLRKLANRGRTIIVVTHATTNITLCDRIVFLGLGGRLCYFGQPQEALDFFQTQDFPDIYNHLENEKNVIQEAKRYLNSNDFTNYVTGHLSEESKSSTNKPPEQSKRSVFQQLFLLTQRYFQLLIRDPVNLNLALLTAPIGIILITLALGDTPPLVLPTEDDPTLAPLALRVLFVFTCAAIWVGLSSSLQEIVKEFPIYQRERLVNLRLFAYLGSKIKVLGGLAIAQTLLMCMAILIGFEDPTPQTLPWPMGLIMTTFLTLFACMNLGLMVSALVKNASQANSALPLLLLPEIIFAGVLFKMEGLGKVISWFMLSRWSVGAYGALVDVNAMVPPPTQLPDGSTIPQPFEPTAVYDPTWDNLTFNWQMLIIHAVIYFLITWWVQKRKDVF